MSLSSRGDGCSIFEAGILSATDKQRLPAEFRLWSMGSGVIESGRFVVSYFPDRLARIRPAKKPTRPKPAMRSPMDTGREPESFE